MTDAVTASDRWHETLVLNASERSIENEEAWKDEATVQLDPHCEGLLLSSRASGCLGAVRLICLPRLVAGSASESLRLRMLSISKVAGGSDEQPTKSLKKGQLYSMWTCATAQCKVALGSATLCWPHLGIFFLS